jgi:hypothetical protein
LAIHLGYLFPPGLTSELERIEKEATYQNRVFFLRNLELRRANRRTANQLLGCAAL